MFPEPMNQKAEEVMKRNGMDTTEHEAIAFDETAITPETLILTMEDAQKSKILSEYGMFGNVYTLNEYLNLPGEVESMYGKSLEEYEEGFQNLRGLIRKLAEKLNMEAKEKWAEYM